MTKHQLELIITLGALLLGTTAHLLHARELEVIALVVAAIGAGMLLSRSGPDG